MKIFEHNNYHFIGIGGIGISAIARMLLQEGKKVSGSDSAESEITKDLEELGIKINISHNTENLDKDTEVVIYSVAVPDSNPELAEAKKRGLISATYPEALGELSRQMYTIAISGTHGKTTTTAMIGHILRKANLDPTIIVGSKMLSDGEKGAANFLQGKSKYLVAEACEYKRSFLNLSPSILVITNIEEDHLDYYKDLTDIQSAFKELANKVPENGFIVTRLSDPNIKEVLKETKAKILDYDSISIKRKLSTPGEHNILNAKAAIKVAEVLGIEAAKVLEYLEDFRGTWRRLEYKGELNGNIYYDDYAHHPSEIKASLSALKEKYPDRKIVAVFEAHQQSRTRLLFNDFVESLKIADEVFIAPIFITREVDDGETTNKKLADAVNQFIPASPIENVEELKEKIKNITPLAPLNLRGGSKEKLCIVLMGAGNIYKWTEEIFKNRYE